MAVWEKCGSTPVGGRGDHHGPPHRARFFCPTGNFLGEIPETGASSFSQRVIALLPETSAKPCPGRHRYYPLQASKALQMPGEVEQNPTSCLSIKASLISTHPAAMPDGGVGAMKAQRSGVQHSTTETVEYKHIDETARQPAQSRGSRRRGEGRGGY